MTDTGWPRIFMSLNMRDVDYVVVFPELCMTIEQLFATQSRAVQVTQGETVTDPSAWQTGMVVLVCMVP